MNRITTILLTISILLVYRANAQYFQSTNYKEGSGLPSSETYSVFQDNKGFVWIATDNGVVRYDGQEFVKYNTANGLPDNTIFGFYEDYKNRIWFRSYNGMLSYYENDSIKLYKFNAELKDAIKQSILTQIAFDSLDELQFTTTLRAITGKIDSAGNVNGVTSAEEGSDFLGYIDDKLLFAKTPPQNIKTIRINGRDFPVEMHDIRNQNNWLIASVRWREKLYFTIYKNIFEYDEKLETLKKVYTADESFICLYVDHQDRLWAGNYNSGVRIFNNSSFKEPASLENIQNISVSSIMQDSEDGVWISTLDQGVFYYPNLTLRHLSLPDVKRVSTVFFGKKEVYLGNYGGDVYYVNQRGDVKLVYPGVAPVNNLFLDNEEKLWISDGTGTHISNSDVNVGSVNGIRGFAFKTVLQVGDSVIGCGSMGFVKMSPDGTVLERIIGRKRPNCMTIANKEIYLGGLNGLERFTPSLQDSDAIKIDDYRTASLINLDDRFIATGTVGHGLFIYDSKTNKLSPLPVSNVSSVYSMITDWPQRRVWIGTEVGLYQLEFSNDTSKVELVHYSKADGLAATKINSVGRIGDDIWAVTDLGISLIPLSHFDERPFVPKFYINRILFKDQSIPANSEVIQTNENSMVIDVRAITFKGRPTSLRYRLGSDQPWQMISAGSIFLSDLRPGEYNIEIEASSGNDVWKKKQDLRISIMARWWETWGFRALAILAILLLGYLAYWLRISAIRRKQKYLELINLHQQKLIDSEIRTQERERKRIAGDLHDGIGTSLSSIKLQIADAMEGDVPDKGRVKEINDNLTDVIDDIKRIVYDLHPPALERYGLHSGLKGLIDRINKSTDINVIFDYYGQSEIVQPVSITIFRILQELINNTLKHARASEIRIHINEFDDEINIMYEDNGIGMIGSRFTGLGLHSIESRVRSLNGRMSWESNHKGTFYNFDIPF